MSEGRPEIELDAVRRAADKGEATAISARVAREDLRWASEPGSDEREGQLQAMLDEISDAMVDIRHFLGRIAWDPIPDEYERPLRSASRRLQYERKQLKKMRRR